MINDDSDYPIVIYWLGFQKLIPFISFHKIISICPLKFSSFAEEIESIKLVFDNFKDFIYKRFFKRDFCWTDPEAIKNSFSLLHTFQIFWYNKLEPLGRKCLSPSEFANERESIEERFCFINTFLTNDPKDQIVREYRRLRQNILVTPVQSPGKEADNTSSKPSPEQTRLVKAIRTIENFGFLVQYVVSQLEMLPSTKFLEEFEWLASQSRSFLKYFFFFFLNETTRFGAKYLIDNLLSDFKISFINFKRLDRKTLIIFRRLIRASDDEMAEALRLAIIIATKVKN